MIYHGLPYRSGAVAIGSPDLAAVRQADPTNATAHWLDAALVRDDIVYFAISEQERTVGQVLLHDVDWPAGEALVAYHRFDLADRGRGIGTEALSLLLAYVRAETSLRRVVSITSHDNLASQRRCAIVQQCGFRFAGPSREDPITGVVHVWQRAVP